MSEEEYPFVQRKESTGNPKVVHLDDERIWSSYASVCVDCGTRCMLYLPEVKHPSSYITCQECDGNNFVLFWGLTENELGDLEFEISPTLWRKRKR